MICSFQVACVRDRACCSDRGTRRTQSKRIEQSRNKAAWSTLLHAMSQPLLSTTTVTTHLDVRPRFLPPLTCLPPPIPASQHPLVYYKCLF